MLELSSGVYDLVPGDFYLIASGHLHRMENQPGSRQYHGFINLTDNPEYFSKSVAGMVDFRWLGGNSIVVKGVAKVSRQMDRIWGSLSTGTPEDRVVGQCLLFYLLTQIEALNPIVVPREDIDSTSLSEHEALHNAIHTIESLYMKKGLRVDEIARACSVSRSYLDQLFHRSLGYGPKRFIQAYRIDRARELIRLGNNSMTEIAEMVGFHDLFTFSKVFKRIDGRPPTALLSGKSRSETGHMSSSPQELFESGCP